MKQINCTEFRSIVDDIGDLDRLPPEAFRHVEHCDPCGAFGRELVTLRALLREPARIAATADFDARLARAIRVRQAESPRGVLRAAAFRAAACRAMVSSSTASHLERATISLRLASAGS